LFADVHVWQAVRSECLKGLLPVGRLTLRLGPGSRCLSMELAFYQKQLHGVFSPTLGEAIVSRPKALDDLFQCRGWYAWIALEELCRQEVLSLLIAASTRFGQGALGPVD